jgi:hypothetical protein
VEMRHDANRSMQHAWRGDEKSEMGVTWETRVVAGIILKYILNNVRSHWMVVCEHRHGTTRYEFPVLPQVGPFATQSETDSDFSV